MVVFTRDLSEEGLKKIYDRVASVLCGKVAEKYRYYLDVKGSSTEDKREIARILWKIFQEEAGITLDRDGIPVTDTSL